MVLFLNVLPALVILLSFVLTMYFASKARYRVAGAVVLVMLALVLWILPAITPSYLPKGTAGVPESLPEWEETDALIEDRLRKPEPDHEEVLEEDLDWKEQVEQEKNETENN